MSVISSSAFDNSQSVSESFACVPIPGKWIVCDSSFTSLCSASFSSPRYSSSNTTTSIPASPDASKRISTSAVPLESLGLNFFVALTGAPSLSSTGFPVFRFISEASSRYSNPFLSPIYSTVSRIVTSLSALA